MEYVRLPKPLVVQLLSLAKQSLALLDEISRSRWEFNKVRLDLEFALKSEGLSELVDAAEAGRVDGIEQEKTPVRRPGAALKAVRLEDDEPTRPDLPSLKPDRK